MYFLYVIIIVMTFPIYANYSYPEEAIDAMTLEQRIAQLIVPSVYINNVESIDAIRALIVKYECGGILLLNDVTRSRITPCEQSRIVFELQQHSRIPLMVMQDCEWGLGMRLDNAVPFPKNAQLAHHDDALLYEFGKEVGRQCALVGVHMNLAPVVDINCNPSNPIINQRSFGSDPSVVIQKSIPVMRGMQDAGIVTCAKHFPGHGDTDVDSHKQLPVINHDKARLHEIELAPFKALIDEGVDVVMVGHLLVPAYDTELPTSLSSKLIIDVLRTTLGFEGIVCTDGLKMKAVSDRYDPGQLAVLAFKAGNDIILELNDVKAGIKAIVAEVQFGGIDELEITRRALKIMRMKEKLGLYKAINPACEDINQINTEYAYKLSSALYSCV
jgi:beta-glucosidase-like glycosyl hydrolase